MYKGRGHASAALINQSLKSNKPRSDYTSLNLRLCMHDKRLSKRKHHGNKSIAMAVSEAVVAHLYYLALKSFC